MLEVTSVVKDAEITMGQGSYMAVSHDAVTRELHLPIAKAGIVLKPHEKSKTVSEFEITKIYQGKEIKQKQYRADVTMELTLINSDNPQEREVADFSAYAFDAGDKAIGKATSLAVKNGLLKMFMLESLDKEEERTTEDANYKQQTKPQSAAPQNQAPVSRYGLSEAQLKRAYALQMQNNWSREDMNKVLKMGFNVEKTSDLTRDQYDQLCKMLLDRKTVEQALVTPTTIKGK